MLVVAIALIFLRTVLITQASRQSGNLWVEDLFPLLRYLAEALAGVATLTLFGFFTLEECGLILGFSRRAMGRLSAAGAPLAFRKMNPAMGGEWIAANSTLITKIGSEKE